MRGICSRVSTGYSYFSKINELENGDEISYTTRFGTEKYVVDNIQEIDEQDWSLLQNTNENKVTLIGGHVYVKL